MAAGDGAPFREELLLPEAEVNAVDALFPTFDRDELWDAALNLVYTQHGGSGLTGLTLQDVWDLDIDRFFFALEFLGDKRRAEAAAMERANRKRK